ncbi:MAG: transporter substrate-binding domain-containing protein [Gammaproteobacteria bacterium]|nr:transporter substrate-binding domain-containing protein [Gammaproteobacteria bacterium]
MRLFVLISILFSSLTITETVAQERLTIATGLKPPLVSSATTKGFLDTLAVELFRRVGIELEVVIVPAKRALVNSNKGIDDGNLLRIKGLEKSYPNLVRVPESIFDSEFVGYSLSPLSLQGEWKKLEGYTTSYVRGWKIFENNIPRNENNVVVGEARQMFELLKEGRTDVVLYEKWQGLLLAKQSGVEGIQVLDPPFVKLNMFMYLNKKHSAIVPKVADELKQMKNDGSYRQIFEQTLGRLIQ